MIKKKNNSKINKDHMIYVSIVAIVAIVAIVLLANTTETSNTAQFSDEDYVGSAVRPGTDDMPECRTSADCVKIYGQGHYRCNNGYCQSVINPINHTI